MAPAAPVAPGATATAAPGAAGPAAPAAAHVAPADPNAVQPVKLRDLQAADGSVRGKVPDEPGWMVVAGNSAIQCLNVDRGELNLGGSTVVCMPGGMTASMAPMFGWIVAPYMPARDAVTHVWPQIRNAIEPGVGFGYVEIVREHPLNWATQFDDGMFEFRFQRGGVPWHGTILISTATVPGDDRWLLYYSQLAVPETDDGSVYQALNACWKAYTITQAPAQQPSPAAAQAQQPAAQPGPSAALQAQRETAKLLDDIHRSLQASRQATFDKHNAAWLDQMRQ